MEITRLELMEKLKESRELDINKVLAILDLLQGEKRIYDINLIIQIVRFVRKIQDYE